MSDAQDLVDTQLAAQAQKLGMSPAQWASCLAMESLLGVVFRAQNTPWGIARLEALVDQAEESSRALEMHFQNIGAAERFFFALALRDCWPTMDLLSQRLPPSDLEPPRKERLKATARRLEAAFSRVEGLALKGLDCSRPVALGFLPLSGALGFFGSAEDARAACPALRRCARIQGFLQAQTLGLSRHGAFSLEPSSALANFPMDLQPARSGVAAGDPWPQSPVAWPAGKSDSPWSFWLSTLESPTGSIRTQLIFRANQALSAGLPVARFPARLSLLAFVEMSSHSVSEQADFWRSLRTRCGEQAVAERIASDRRSGALLPWLLDRFAGRPKQLLAELDKMAPRFPSDSPFWRPKEHPQWKLFELVSKLNAQKLAGKDFGSVVAECSARLAALGFKADGSRPDGSYPAADLARPTLLFWLIDCPAPLIEALAPVLKAAGVDFNAKAGNGQTALGRLNARARSTARKTGHGAEFDVAFALLVQLGADPVAIAPAPNPLDIAATPAMAALVRAHMEKEEIVRSLSEAELRQAIDFWKAHQAAQAPAADSAPPKPPRRRL